MLQLIQDIECNRCHEVYKSNENRVMSVMVDHTYLSICPKCTKEVAALMGLTPENITKQLSLIKYAETENNRQYDIEHGNVCKKCEKIFNPNEPRVRLDASSNILSWHLACYELLP